MHRQTGRFSTPSPASQLYGVLHADVDKYWFEILPLINSALQYADGKYTANDIYAALKDRRQQLWLSINDGIEACCVTEITNYPNKRVCTVFLAAGRNISHWLAFMETIEHWAKSCGCDSIECYGRPGWEKILNWERTSVIVRKHL